jgi:hypothetical protein
MLARQSIAHPEPGGNGRARVVGAHRIDEDGSVGLAVGSYDRSPPLVIDPVVLGLASRLGG